MTIEWLSREHVTDRAARRRQVVLTEFQLGHVPAFRQVFIDQFDVSGRALPAEPGWFRTSGGGLYEVVLIARSGAPVPAGVEIAALPERFTPLTAAAVDADIWDFLQWLLTRTGEPWTPQALAQVAALYRIPEGQVPGDR